MGETLVNHECFSCRQSQSGKCERNLHRGTKIYSNETNQYVRYCHEKKGNNSLFFDISSERKHTGTYKIDLTVLCKQFYLLCGVNKLFIRGVVSLWSGFSQFVCCSAGYASS
jgi:hypothetical protein